MPILFFCFCGAWTSFNENSCPERAKALADEVFGEALLYEALETFRPETGAILANASAIGMKPNSHQSPVSKVFLSSFFIQVKFIHDSSSYPSYFMFSSGGFESI